MTLFSCCNCDVAKETDTQLSVEQTPNETLRVSENFDENEILHLTEEDKLKEKERLHKLVKAFAKAAVCGISCMFLDVTTGEQIPAKYIIDKSMETFSVLFDEAITLTFDMASLQEVYSYEDLLQSPNTEYLASEKTIYDLPVQEKRRLVMLEYLDPQNTHLNRLFFIDKEYETDQDRFVICMKILRLYCTNSDNNET